MLGEAAEADAAEDARLGAARGDELPDELAERTSRKARLRQAKAKLEAQAREQRVAYEAHLAERARIEAERGRPLRGRKPKPPAEAPAASARVNTTDPDSGLMRTREGFVQGYNAQAVVVADAGYWNVPQIERVLAGGTDVLVSPVSATQGIPAALGQPRNPRAKRMQGRCLEMHEKLSTPAGRALYARRKQLVEPVFAQTKVVAAPIASSGAGSQPAAQNGV